MRSLPDKKIFMAVNHLPDATIVFFSFLSPNAYCLLPPINPIDETLFFQLAHDAVVDQAVYGNFASGRLFQGVVELDFHSFASRVRNALENFTVES